MGLRYTSHTIPDEPQAPPSLPVIMEPPGKVAKDSGETVQPGTKFRPFDRRDTVPSPLGKGIFGRGISQPSIYSVPQVVVKTNRGGTFARPAVVGRGKVPSERSEPVVPQRAVIPPPVIPRLVSTDAGRDFKGGNMGLDLGNLLNTGLDLYGKYLGLKNPVPAPIPFSQQPIMGAPVTTFPGQGFGVDMMAGPSLIDFEPGGGLPGFDVISEPPTDDTRGWVYKKVCGQWKWTKPKRRRRRKLLTDSDYNGLLKLQTLKVNSNMNIAIAKSIGR